MATNLELSALNGGVPMTDNADDDLLAMTDVSDTSVAASGKTKPIEAGELIVKKVRETGGPTALTVAAVPNGQFLKRSGTDIVGSALASTDLSDFAEAVEDKIGAKVIAGTGISVSYNDGTGETTVTNTATGGAGGFGDVVGPGSATDNAVTRFDSTTGKLIQNSNLTLPDDAATTEVGYMNIPQNSQSADYTLVIADRGKHIYHPTSDDNPRTFTIPANASVAYSIGTAITFVNDQNTLTIAITSDTLVWAEDGSTGSRTLAENGIATAIKVTSTRWLISGTGLS